MRRAQSIRARLSLVFLFLFLLVIVLGLESLRSLSYVNEAGDRMIAAGDSRHQDHHY